MTTPRERAAHYLTEVGVKVLDQDWHPDGALDWLDLVAEEHGVIVAAVLRSGKQRYTAPMALSAPRIRLQRGALAQWMRDHGKRSDKIRVDLIGVLEDTHGFVIEHVRGAG